MTYKVVKNANNGHDILEVDTDTVLSLKKTEKDARDICRKLNLGSGFVGWTPSFLAAEFA